MAGRSFLCKGLQPANCPALYAVFRAFTEKHISDLIYALLPLASLLPPGRSQKASETSSPPCDIVPAELSGLLTVLFWIFFFFHKAPARGKQERKEPEMELEERLAGPAGPCPWNMTWESHWREGWANRLFRIWQSNRLQNIPECEWRQKVVQSG